MKLLRQIVLNASLLLLPVLGHAMDLSQISNQDAASALRTTLSKGADSAIQSLGQANGFMNNPQVHIPLPAFLNDHKGMLKMVGMGSQLDAVEQSMNHAAEAAVPKAANILKKAIQGMSVSDAKSILGGGNTAVTEFFKSKTKDDLYAALLPIVKGETGKLNLTQQYNTLAQKGSKFGLVDASQANLESYVTNQALSGLFTMIGNEEQAIRADPVGTGSALLKKVFSK